MSDDKGARKTGKTSSGRYGLVLTRTMQRQGDSGGANERYQRARGGDDDRPPLTAKDAEAEARDASVSLLSSVDQICQALVLVFDRIEAASSALSAVSRVLTILLLAQVCVFGVMGYTVWRLESVVATAEQNHAEQAKASREIEGLVTALGTLQRSTEATKRSVDEVATKTDEAPKLEIVADTERPGSAVVRISPGSPKAPPPLPNGPPAASSQQPPSVEIPLRLDKARSAPPDASP